MFGPYLKDLTTAVLDKHLECMKKRARERDRGSERGREEGGKRKEEDGGGWDERPLEREEREGEQEQETTRQRTRILPAQEIDSERNRQTATRAQITRKEG